VIAVYPRAVLATAFVDPILPAIGRAMGASPAQVELLFTSYIAVMSLTMSVSGALATRLGGRRTLLAGLAVVVVFAFLSGNADGVFTLAGWRAFWGFGNSLFTSTALSLIVGLTTGGLGRAITLYEAALGLGIASGPLLGGLLGAMNWRYPFFGTAALMFVAFAVTFLTVPEPGRAEERRTPVDVLRALGNRWVASMGVIGLLYSYGFFAVLTYAPFYLHLGAQSLGVIFFAWGLLVAVTSVFVAPWLRRRLAPTTPLVGGLVLFGVLLVLLYALPRAASVPLVVLTGAFIGVNNALLTSFAMEVSPFTRSISSAAYNMVRWAGAALAPWLSGVLAATSPRLPFAVAAVAAALAVGALAVGRRAFDRRIREREAALSQG
jgi:ACDE family multidrug resistance protein